MEDSTDAPTQRRAPYQPGRSTNSFNWRVKEEGSRQELPQQGRYRRENEYGQPSSRHEGYSRRDNAEYQPREQREIPGKPDSQRLYVGNLLYTAQADDITNFFTNNGFNVTNVSMSIDPATGRNPSYCFVDLESVDEATRAMEQLNGAEVLGRSVRINPGVARREGQSGGPRRGFGTATGTDRGWRDRESNGGYQNAPQRPTAERWGNRASDPSQPYSRPSAVDQSKRIYVGGLPPLEPQSAVEAEISALFSRADPPIEFANVSNLISPHASKASEPGDHHYLFVDLKVEGDAERAIEIFNDMESPWSEGGRLRVNRARENRDREGRDGPRRGGRDSGRTFGRGNWRQDQLGEQ